MVEFENKVLSCLLHDLFHILQYSFSSLFYGGSGLWVNGALDCRGLYCFVLRVSPARSVTSSVCFMVWSSSEVRDDLHWGGGGGGCFILDH